ncbi:putative pectinesterase/pectinesterase inhibitor 34 [Hibiscus syriacus]|uniref:Pectinesterase n=1 Tax=Hibiscus syriacus TaxID=106335 RepID=A0A6A3C6J5_HIBSY|nr:probable pectinesterase/pectinesterase inhibitor 61 [Hibiscus syriacus]KAE8723188.1 putative pectinesterase/pectinesterase inhibitor 34 [Hibiscus syriacus]
MAYDRLRPSEPGGSGATQAQQKVHEQPKAENNKRNIVILSVIAVTMIIVSAVCAGLVIGLREGGADSVGNQVRRKPTRAISKTCSRTRFPSLCVNSLLEFPGSLTANEQGLVHISFNITLQHFSKALYTTTSISYVQMDPRVRSAYDDCLELLEDSVDALSRSLSSVIRSQDGNSKGGSTQDVMTWLSAALTNHDTCTEGFEGVSGTVKDQVTDKLKDLSELVSNCLSIFAASGGDDFAGVPIQNRRLLSSDDDLSGESVDEENFPKWLGRKERELLSTPLSAIQADIIVSKDGNGTVKTIAEAIKKVPEHSTRRVIIYVRAGRYEEDNLKVGRKKTNVMFIGDGKGKTVISGRKSVSEDLTTFHTAAFAATGSGFIAADMTFENYAGPAKHQAVALRIGADHAVVYRCNIIGYQDTLYVHSNRQFYRECDIYGTVDFIFGNAAVVIQNCNIYARKPMASQKNTVTAQNRKDPNQNTGISIHKSRILPTPDLDAAKGSFPTYLGRPWKMYSRTVFMLSYMGDHIHPRGWLEWNGNFALDTLYYGEYKNNGPGAAIRQRVKWPGYRVITSETEASKFTVAQFIYGSSWLPLTGVAFMSGLHF